MKRKRIGLTGEKGKSKTVTLGLLLCSGASSNKLRSTNERLYTLKWHCGKAKRQWEWQSFIGRNFAGGNRPDWWIQC